MTNWLQLFWLFLKVNLLTTSGPASVGLLYKEAVPLFMTESQFVEAVGFSSALPGTPASSIVNCSGLSCQNRLVNMLNLIGGGDRQFVARRPSEDPAVQAAIAAMPPWPEPGSIRFLDGVFVIKGS